MVIDDIISSAVNDDEYHYKNHLFSSNMASRLLFSCLFGVIFCQRHHVLSDLKGKQLLGAHSVIQAFHLHSLHPGKWLHTQCIQSSKRLFFFSFEHTPPSISPQLPLKHNQCLPTRLPSISCLVTTSPLLSTTKCVTNSELNLEMPLIYPPDWIDRSLCLIFTHSSIFLYWNQKLLTGTVSWNQCQDRKVIHTCV